MNFNKLPVGAYFYCNGNLCRKQSTRTALLCDYGRVFYFAGNTRVQTASKANP